jgi:RNA-binding motif protein, X-linked 2
MNTIQEIKKINERELELGLAGTAASWHATYGKSAWIYVGNVAFDLTEGDLICVLSQYGEVDDLWLVRNDETGISRGYGYAKYVDARSCVLAVDNFIGITVRNTSSCGAWFHFVVFENCLPHPHNRLF